MFRRSLLATATTAAVLFAVATTAQAAPVTFFGEDLSNGNPVASHPNSDAARANFFSNLTGVSTETFEGIATGTSVPFAVSFGAAGTATLTGGGSVQSGASSSNQFPISGTKYFNTTSTFLLTFSSPISAFGFYGTDIGDVSANLTLTLTGSNGTTVLNVPNVVNSTTADGSALYFGFYDTANTYTSISFAGAGSDVFGFDDFSIGSRAQVTPNPVPEPATLAVLASGLVGLGLLRRRRKD